MCAQILKDSPTMEDFLKSLANTNILEVKYWLTQLCDSWQTVNEFYSFTLTSERVQFIIDDMTEIISRNLKFADCNGNFWLTLWNGHRFMDEIRQKALGFNSDPEMAITNNKI